MKKIKPFKPIGDNQELRFVRVVEWDCGTHYSYYGRFRLVANDREMRVEKLRRFPLPPEWSVTFKPVRLVRADLEGERKMASKWIKLAVTKKSKVKPTALNADPMICDGRPALTDFMTDLEGADGGPREPSVVMIGFTSDGVRVGLKDDDAGGWCWREGKTIKEALDAIEKALQAGEGAFRGPRPQVKKKK